MNKIFTIKCLLTSLCALFFLQSLFAQISITSTSSAITQNFNTLAISGTTNVWADNSTIPGWYANNRPTYIGDAGTSTTGALYSYGSATTTERALGGLTSGSTPTVQFGIRLVNNTGAALSGLTISFRGEQWRQNATAHTLVFESQVGATAITTGTWSPTTALNFIAPQIGTAGALDGNAAGNFTALSATISATVANGQEIWLRWTKTGSSSPGLAIDDLSITAISSAACATPTAAATSMVFGTITSTSIQASFTPPSPSPDSYLVIMSSNSSLGSYPINNQVYNIGDNVGDGSVISKGTVSNFTATGLSPQTNYYFFVFPMNALCSGGPLYYTQNLLNGMATTIAGVPSCTAPPSQPTNLIFGSTTSNSIVGSFTSTTCDEYLIVRSTAASLSANPSNATIYNTGDAIGNGTVVQKSTATSFTATGLSASTAYTFFVFSLNSQSCINGPTYNVTNPLTATQSTAGLQACVTPAAQPTNLVLTPSNNIISGTFTGVSGADDYLVIKSTSPTLGAIPTDNTDYAAGAIFGSGTVVSNSSNTTFLASNLAPSTTYYFFVFAANKTCSGGTKYATQTALTGNISTSNAAVNNYYFGTLHSHSDYSDGNKDNPTYTPTDDYNFAMGAQCMDFLGISEHNHYSSANNPGNQVGTYHQGSIQANSFTSAHPNFLALYGMEWGVISGGGHVVVYGDGMDDLWGWESGSGVWGTSNNYDTYIAKNVYTGSTGLFSAVNANIAKNTFATLAHPNSGDYNNIANITYDAVADSAIVGAAVESGPAFSTTTNYTNPGTSFSYLSYYQQLLSKGYHLGPTIDHDNHYTTFGRATYSRTAVVAPSLTKTSIISALRNMHFYATQDCDTKVDFTINTKIMGSIFTNNFAPNISVTLTDVTTSVSSAIIKIMYGIPGSGTTAVNINSVTGSSLQYTDNNLANLATGYYYIDITNGASRIITAPIWYTRNDASAVPVKLSLFTVQKNNKSAQLDWITDIEVNSSHFIIQRSIDGRNWNDIARVNAEGNSSISKAYRLFDNTPLNGINYYRLKQIDLDGKFEYSMVKSAQFNLNYQVEISPNPARDFITINTTQNSTKVIYIELLDISGKVLKKLTSTQNQTKLNVAGIAKGIYFVKVNDADNVITQRIVIE